MGDFNCDFGSCDCGDCGNCGDCGDCDCSGCCDCGGCCDCCGGCCDCSCFGRDTGNADPGNNCCSSLFALLFGQCGDATGEEPADYLCCCNSASSDRKKRKEEEEVGGGVEGGGDAAEEPAEVQRMQPVRQDLPSTTGLPVGLTPSSPQHAGRTCTP